MKKRKRKPRKIRLDPRKVEKALWIEVDRRIREYIDRSFFAGGAGHAFQACALAGAVAGERLAAKRAKQKKQITLWTDDLDCRRAAAVAYCHAIIENFVHPARNEQLLTVMQLENVIRKRGSRRA